MSRPTISHRTQESVWDYPRPPAVEPTDETVEVTLDGVVVAHTTGALRVLETSHPPTYYLPATDVDRRCLVAVGDRTVCEWKGSATYFDVETSRVAARAAWTYPNPTARFQTLAGYIAFYPGLVECRVDGELVRPQPGGFYGGWVTSRVSGPFKGGPGTTGW